MREHVWRNLDGVAEALSRAGHGALVERLRHPGAFTFDGSVVVGADARLRYPRFFDSTRASLVSSRRVLRGPRYLASIDPTLEVRQKLLVLQDDLRAAAHIAGKALKTRSDDPQRFLEFSAILDYAKNAAITIFNALVLPEKRGHFLPLNRPYQRIRRQALALASAATAAHYSHLLLQHSRFVAAVATLQSQLRSVSVITAHIEKAYVDGTFSSRYFTRPEAGHPLVLCASAFLGCHASPDVPDLILGLPSGGTELALLQQLMFAIVRNARPPLLLVPYSLHSVKEELDTTAGAPISDVVGALRRGQCKSAPRTVLLVEDNSSTGRTVQQMADAAASAWPGVRVVVSVAEADVIRSAIDRHASHRTFVASPTVHRYAVNVLPVSRKLSPKTDLKELAERRRLAAHYRALLARARRDVEEIQFRVYLRLIREYRSVDAGLHAQIGHASPSRREWWDPLSVSREYIRKGKQITDFTNTFLSNFYITPRPLVYDHVEYPSVEHAYQAQKFSPRVLASVSPIHVTAIRELMHSRGHKWDRDELVGVFRDAKVSAGSVKRTAEYLRVKGYVRGDWDDVKVPIMIELLLQKYRQPQLRKRLLSTSGKYLVEGNTWRDTLWGVYGGRGRNLLGLILMEIRDVLDRESAVRRD